MIWITSETNKCTLQFDYIFYTSIYNCKENIFFFHIILPIWFGMRGSTLVASLCVQEVSKILSVQGLFKKECLTLFKALYLFLTKLQKLEGIGAGVEGMEQHWESLSALSFSHPQFESRNTWLKQKGKNMYVIQTLIHFPACKFGNRVVSAGPGMIYCVCDFFYPMP